MYSIAFMLAMTSAGTPGWGWYSPNPCKPHGLGQPVVHHGSVVTTEVYYECPRPAPLANFFHRLFHWRPVFVTYHPVIEGPAPELAPRPIQVPAPPATESIPLPKGAKDVAAPVGSTGI